MKTILNLILLVAMAISAHAQDKPLEASGLMLENIKYPFPVKEINLSIQGQKLVMAYMDIQPATPNGKTVVLLHGKNFSAAYWEQTANALSKDGYRVIMPDQIGFGKSSKPTDIQYSFQLLAQNTKAILDELKVSKIYLLGHSMGGMVATRFALMYPDTVEKLILENPIGLEDWKTVVPYQSVDDWYAAELKQDYQKMKDYQLKFYYDNKWKPEYDRWLNINAGWTLNKEYPVIAKNAALTYDMIFTQPIVYEFENLKMPVLLIIGQRDRTALGKGKAPKDVQEKLGNYPVLGRETAKKIKNATLVEIDNVGHLPHIEAYDKFIGPFKEFLKK
ncbi:alpha/beta hydrolase [Flavobacterium rivuli WB 3.3-2 = DSM 21788]|uniref:Alpha/beta hydrolase n=1 Tax=Flavobacterium rivuli WB 3.3-2 = DSM 21788 TaxID=1121895 RepID=A0A0A2LY74_9FLAO|nr:alpha/beta hydrolase [Flavobacterium rivuli]KGO85337.1 alpha/beta hydrolase [Flavobacterium rivuli WB 3.3-2 = DSM 21788]